MGGTKGLAGGTVLGQLQLFMHVDVLQLLHSQSQHYSCPFQVYFLFMLFDELVELVFVLLVVLEIGQLLLLVELVDLLLFDALFFLEEQREVFANVSLKVMGQTEHVFAFQNVFVQGVDQKACFIFQEVLVINVEAFRSTCPTLLFVLLAPFIQFIFKHFSRIQYYIAIIFIIIIIIFNAVYFS